MNIDKSTICELIKASIRGQEKAYAPYSKLKVGAALLAANGTIIEGCNVENCAFPVTTCAEKCALVKAVSEGHRDFKAVVVTSNSKEIISPCGNCRQALSEFGLTMWVIMADSETMSYEAKLLEDLLPLSFTPKMLPQAKN